MFLEMGREGEREGEKYGSSTYTWVASPTTQAWALTGNQTCDHLAHRPVLKPLSYTSQGPNRP